MSPNPLSSEAIRNLARSLFAGFVSEGLSANQALSILREKGLGYRRQDFLRDYREFKGIFESRSSIKYVGEDKIPSDALFEDRYFGVPDHYAYLYKWKGVDAKTGEVLEGYAYYFSNFKGKKGEIEEHIAQGVTKSSSYELETFEFKVYEAFKNPYWEEF